MARQAEALGFDELWFAEDYFYTGGFSTATAALASTNTITVGTGIVSALVRHPAVLAMEIASVARMFPNRFRPGIALGHPPAIRSIGLYPRSPLTAVRDCIMTVRGLLRGQEVSHVGEVFSLRDVHLAHPAPDDLQLLQGGMGPKMLQLAGEIADGAIIPLMATPDYVTWVRDQLEVGKARRNDVAPHHSVTVFVFFSLADDPNEAKNSVKETVAFYLYELSKVAVLPEEYGIPGDVKRSAAEGIEAVLEAIDRTWPDSLMAVGTAAECVRRVNHYYDAGADSVVLYLMPAANAKTMVQRVCDEILPHVRDRSDLNV
jgi:alkanesulfonate monooxygenase SsuD/methylene tetrahydromethanopterin reductase-like flavin-dependent oxidoreductase (luciferase family)